MLKNKASGDFTPLVLTRDQAARLLGAKSVRLIDRLSAQGFIRRVLLPGRKRAIGVLREDIEGLVEQGMAVKAR